MLHRVICYVAQELILNRFIESLSARVHPTPMSIDSIAELYQDFYVRASSHIATHIAALSSQLSRTKRSGTLTPPKGGAKAKASKAATSDAASDDQQMLTVSEITDRKKKRKLLEVKRIALEEAVERAVCEKVYPRLWRHRSTDDGEQDEKLRSRTAALSLIKIGLGELLVKTEDLTDEVRKTTAEKQDEVQEWLAPAKESLRKMDNERYPVGKLDHLKDVHKTVVETLSKLFPSTSSADEILPTLIYVLIISPPEGMSVISNLRFIQRFRTASKVDGEAAYCLINLEAAVSFLETVDLSSLRADEAPEGPAKSHSRPSTPRTHTAPTPMRLGIPPVTDPGTGESTVAVDSTPGTPTKPLPSPTKPRRFSNLVQAKDRIESAGDTVRGVVLGSADQAFDTISESLSNSFKFVFGRLKEQQESSGMDGRTETIIPKTLEDARKLVSTPPPEDADDVSVHTESEQMTEKGESDAPQRQKVEARVSELFGGKRPSARERSVDSQRSTGSGKKVAFADGSKQPPLPASEKKGSENSSPPSSIPATAASNPFGGFNPLSRISSIGLPRFGRAPTSQPGTPTMEQSKELATPPATDIGGAAQVAEINSKGAIALAAFEELRKTSPPSKKFMDIKDAKELKLGDVDDLLKDYQRLALALKTAVQATK